MAKKLIDETRIPDMYDLIQKTYRRMNALRITRDQFCDPDPDDDLLNNHIDGLENCAYRVMEHLCRLSQETIDEYPDMQWSAIHGMRNRLAHDYDAVDPAFVWSVLTVNFAEVEKLCIDYCKNHEIELSDRVKLNLEG